MRFKNWLPLLFLILGFTTAQAETSYQKVVLPPIFKNPPRILPQLPSPHPPKIGGFGGVTAGGGQITSRLALCHALILRNLPESIDNTDHEISKALRDALVNIASIEQVLESRFFLNKSERQIQALIASSQEDWSELFREFSQKYCLSDDWKKIGRLGPEHLEYVGSALKAINENLTAP